MFRTCKLTPVVFKKKRAPDVSSARSLGPKGSSLEGTTHLYFFVGFYNVAYFYVVEIVDVQTTLVARNHLFHIVFKALERAQITGVNNNAVTYQADLGISLDLTFFNHTTGNGADFGNLEDFAYFHGGNNLFLNFGRKHAFHSGLDFFDGVVNNGVETNIDFLLFGNLPGRHTRAHLETNHNGIRCSGQHNVRLGYGTYRLVNHIHLNFFGTQFDQGIGQSLNGSIHVALHNQVQLLEVANGNSSANLIEGNVLLGTYPLLTLQLLTLVGNILYFLLTLQHIKLFTGLRCSIKTKNKHRLRGTNRLNFLVALIKHGLNM